MNMKAPSLGEGQSSRRHLDRAIVEHHQVMRQFLEMQERLIIAYFTAVADAGAPSLGALAYEPSTDLLNFEPAAVASPPVWPQPEAQAAAPSGSNPAAEMEPPPAQGRILATPETQESAAPGGGPLPGSVEDGYRFLGGDPANPKNWEPV